LSKNLLTLINDEKRRKEMGEIGYAFVKDKFTYNRLASDMDLLYKELLDKKNTY